MYGYTYLAFESVGLPGCLVQTADKKKRAYIREVRKPLYYKPFTKEREDVYLNP